MNRFAVPLRSYSKSYPAGWPGRAGSGAWVSFVRCLEVSSTQTSTVPPS